MEDDPRGTPRGLAVAGEVLEVPLAQVRGWPRWETAYERSKKKVATVLGLEFGELIHWSKLSSPGKLSLKWDLGIFLGVRPLTGEVVVGDAEGVWFTRTIHRQPMDAPWNYEEARAMMQGIPRDTSREDGPYQDPEEQSGGGIEEPLAGWDEARPAPASSRRTRRQDEAEPYRVRYERENTPTDEDEPAPYPYGDIPVSSRSRAGLRREAEDITGASSGPSGQAPGAATGGAGGAEEPVASGRPHPLTGEQDLRPMIKGGPPRGVVPILGDSSADEDAPADAQSGRPSGRKLVIRKSRGFDMVSSTATVRASRDTSTGRAVGNTAGRRPTTPMSRRGTC